MIEETKKMLSIAKQEKDINKRIQIIADLFQKDKYNFKVILDLLFAIGQIPEYRQRAKELLNELTYYHNVNFVYFYLAKLEILDNNTIKAKEYLEDILEDSPKYQPAILESAKLDLKTNNEINGKRKLLYLAKHFNDGAAYYELGKIAEKKKNYYLAKEDYQKAIEINPKDIKSMFKLAKLEKDYGNNSEAERLLNRILKFNENDKRTLLERGKIECEKGSFDKAREYFEKILSSAEDPAARIELGLIEEILDNYELAEEHYKKSLSNGNIDYSYIHLGLLHKKLGNYQMAKEYFSKVGGSNEINALLETVNVELKKDNINEALLHFEKLLNHKDIKNIDPRKIKRIKTYIEYKIGTLVNDEAKDYYTSQLMNYNPNKTLTTSKNYFSDYIDIKKCLEHSKEKLTKENFNTTTAGCDYYDIELDFSVGIIGDRETNFVAVSTILNTDKIILMQPTIPKQKKIPAKKRIR